MTPPVATVVVVPTIREQHARAFLERWEHELVGATVALERCPIHRFVTRRAHARQQAITGFTNIYKAIEVLL